MADTSIFSISPPAWLQRNAQPISGEEAGQAVAGLFTGTAKALTNDQKQSGMNFLQAFGTGYQDALDVNFELKRNSALLKLQEQKSSAELQNASVKDRMRGMQELPEWLRSTGNDPQKILDTPFTGTSEWASDQVMKAKNAAWMRWNQQQAIEVKKGESEAKIEAARQAVELKKQQLTLAAQKNKDWAAIQNRLADIQAAKVNAAKAGKSYEFEQLQNDYDETMREASQEQDPDVYKQLIDRANRDLERMKRISEFAATIPTTTEKDIQYDAAGNRIKETTVKSTPGAAVNPKSKDPLGLFTK